MNNVTRAAAATLANAAQNRTGMHVAVQKAASAIADSINCQFTSERSRNFYAQDYCADAMREMQRLQGGKITVDENEVRADLLDSVLARVSGETA